MWKVHYQVLSHFLVSYYTPEYVDVVRRIVEITYYSTSERRISGFHIKWHFL